MKRVTHLAEMHLNKDLDLLVAEERPYQTINRLFRQYHFDYYNMLNPFPGDEGTYYIAKYGLWVRSSDQVVIDTNHGSEGIGLTLNEWLLRYAPVTPPENATEG